VHGGKVDASEHREYGTADITVIETGNANADALFKGLDKEMQVSARVSRCKPLASC
jgi:GMP synthase-like glutamine amidotransferase